MSPKYMLDTNICIYLMKHQPKELGLRFAQYYVGEVVISAITLTELTFGVACSGDHKAHNQTALNSLLDEIVVMPFDTNAAHSYGPLRAAHRERSKDALDKLIASHALALEVILVTNNEGDFMAYPGLVVENWVNYP